MAEIVSRLNDANPHDTSAQATSSDEGSGAMRMTAKVTIDQGVATFFLGSGSTGYTCNGTFSAPGMPNNTILSFDEKDGLLRITDGAKLEGTTLGVYAFNMDSLMSQKGILSLMFVHQNGDKEEIHGVFMTPQTPDKTLLDLPDLQGIGWGVWSGPV